MPDGIRWVGLDVHARESTVAIFDQATGEVLTRRVVGRPHELLPMLREIPRPAQDGVRGGPDRLRPGAPCSGGGDRAGGVRAGQDRAARRRTGSRPTSVTRSAWPGCWPRAS